MRILISGTTYSPARNGQAVFTTALAEGLVRRGHQVMLLGQSELGRPYQAERNGVKIYAARSLSLAHWYPGTAATLFPEQAAWRAIAAFRPDIVHLQDHYPISRYALRYARHHGIKAIGTNHFMPENFAPYLGALAYWMPVYRRLLWNWMLEVYNRLDLVTAPSRTAVEILQRQGLRRPAIPVSCGIDLDRFHPDPSVDRQATLRRFGLDPDRLIFLFLGRVDGEKRLDVLIHALPFLEREDVQLAIAGKGAALISLQVLAEGLGLGDRVHFTGSVPDSSLPDLLNSIDFFAMPSQAELLSIATLEAMACARPVLLARAQALPELVSEGINGYVFEPGNSAEAAQKIDLLASQSPQHRVEMGTASLAKAQAHNLESVLKCYEDFYTSLSNAIRDRLNSTAWSFVFTRLKRVF